MVRDLGEAWVELMDERRTAEGEPAPPASVIPSAPLSSSLTFSQ